MNDKQSNAPAPKKKKRVGAETSPTRLIILDMTEKLMLSEGYAAVSTRRVAAEAGLKPSLVHYYFPTTDDLFLAVYHRAVRAVSDSLDAAIASEKPLHAMWALMCDTSRTALAIEFMALSNHRTAIAEELARCTTLARRKQADALQSLLAGKVGDTGISPIAFSVVLAGLSRALVLEGGLSISLGHDDARAWMEDWLDKLEPDAR